MDKIIRERQHGRFTIVPNEIFKAQLSLKAIGLLTYILHLPDDWRLYKTQLYKSFPQDKRTSVEGAWKELERAGYVRAEKGYNAAAKMPETTYFVYDVPKICVENQHTEVKKKRRNVDFQQSEIRNAENQHLLNTNSILNTNSTNSTSTTVDVPKKSVKEKKPKKERIKPVQTTIDTDTPRAENQSASAPKKAISQQVVDMYYTWHQEREGIPPKIDGAQGNAAKALAAYLRTVVRDRAREQKKILDEAGEDEKIMQTWKYVLDNYGKVDGFYQDRLRLIDFNHNIQNILKQLKDGIAKKNNGNGNKKIDAGGLQAAMQVVTGRFGKGGTGTTGS